MISLRNAVVASALALSIAGTAAPSRAQDSPAASIPALKLADPTEQGAPNATASARREIPRPLPFSDSDVAAKAGANRARAEAEQKGVPFSPRDLAAAGVAGAGPLAPICWRF
jgi:hypothetical protein